MARALMLGAGEPDASARNGPPIAPVGWVHYTCSVQASNKTPAPSPSPARWYHDPRIVGTLCGLVSAFGYTCANACLRAVSQCDAVWVSCVKAFPTVAIFGPIVMWRWTQGREALPPRRQLAALVAVSIVCQLFGNVVFQWSLGIVGMALAVPLTLGMMIVAGAMMGRVLLHESVTIPMAISTLVLIGAMFVLSLGAKEASQTMAGQSRGLSIWLVAAGVGAALGSGIAYAMLGVVIRYAVTDRISILMTLVSVTLTGVIVLGAASLARVGWRGMLATSQRDLSIMLLAGFFNAMAFLALTRSLQLIPVIYVNALNATQATMAAITGVLLFAERSSWALWYGVALTVVGLILMQKRLLRPRGKSRKPVGG